MQIAYPYIYNQLSEEPDFKQWDESIAAKLKLRKLTVDEQESLDAAEEFNDEWEKILFRMCQKETHLSNRVFQVSGLLNKIAAIVNNDEQLGDIISATMELSAVTNLKAFDTTPKASAAFTRKDWADRVGEDKINAIDHLFDLLNKASGKEYKPGYTHSFIGVRNGSRSCNFFTVRPRKKSLRICIRVEKNDQWDSIMNELSSGTRYTRGWYFFNTDGSLKGADKLTPILQQAEAEFFNK
jgi:hypothetical protein